MSMKSDLDKNQHSVYRLTYHLVLVIKYRRQVINEEI
jgi:putative transposase